LNNVKLKLLKYNSITEYYLEDYCTQIKLSNNINQIASELSFTIPYATFSDNLLPIKIEMGDHITLVYTHIEIDTTIFFGIVTDTKLKGKAQTLEVTCYDYTWWVCKCNITNNFNNISVGDALKYIYTTMGAVYEDPSIELEDNANIMIGTHLVKDKPASKVIYAIYNYITKTKKNVYYYMHATNDGATISVTECDKYFSGLTIKPASTDLNGEIEGNLIDYQVDNSMQNMVTEVDFFKTTGEQYTNIGTDGILQIQTGRYGSIIENVEVDDNDTTGQLALAEGQKILNEKGKPQTDITVTCFGDLAYKVGYGVVAEIPNTDYYDICMYIIGSEWTWNKDGSFISKLELSQSKYTNNTDWLDIETKTEALNDVYSGSNGNSDSASSDLVNEIIAELKKYLELAYVYGGKSPADGGMDCSGYIAYVYNQFSSQLEITSNDGELTSCTYYMMNEGKDVTSDFPNNLRPCDLIFPAQEQGGHVVAYIGNGQIIEEPSSGEVCRVVTMSDDSRFNSAYKVIRVIPDSAWSSSSSNSNSSTGTNSGLASSQLIEFIKGYEKFVSPAADDGYGTITIGYGETLQSRVEQGTCTEDEATEWLQDDVNTVAAQIKSALDQANVSLPQNQFDCLVDIGFNNNINDLIGGLTWESIINGEDKNTITGHILNWNHANGQVSPGLTKRCAARVMMFFDGSYDSDH